MTQTDNTSDNDPEEAQGPQPLDPEERAWPSQAPQGSQSESEEQGPPTERLEGSPPTQRLPHTELPVGSDQDATGSQEEDAENPLAKLGRVADSFDLPTSEDVRRFAAEKADVLEKAGGRNLKLAIITGLTLATLVIGLLILGRVPFFVLALVVVTLAQFEFYSAVSRAGYRPASALGLVAGVVMFIGTFMRGEGAIGLVLFLTVLFSAVWYMAVEDGQDLLRDVAVTILGVAYIPLLGSFFALLLRRPDALGVVIAAIGAAAVYDVAAYAGGSFWGRRPLAPNISPKKTWEGALVGTAMILILGPPLILLLNLGPWDYGQALLFTALASIFSPMGDLFESLLKRDLGIKDMGGVFPGHGGALDRIDALLFVAPAAYFALRMFGI